MANVPVEDRVRDTDIKKLNFCGIGLRAIAEELGCHPATITTRLEEMGIPPTDTRRSFMAGVFSDLTQEEKDWFSTNLYTLGIPARAFVAQVIKREFLAAPAAESAAAPEGPLEMEGQEPARVTTHEVGSEENGPEFDGGEFEPREDGVQDLVDQAGAALDDLHDLVSSDD